VDLVLEEYILSKVRLVPMAHATLPTVVGITQTDRVAARGALSATATLYSATYFVLA